MILTALAVALALVAPPDAVRTGGPSAPGDVKIAVVGSSRELAGTPFSVVDAGGRVVLVGTLAKATGAPAPWPHGAVADLSELREPGAYSVRVGSLTSRPWVVQARPGRELLRVLLRFFWAQADGRERSWLHGPSHLDDAVVAGGTYRGRRFDLSGGWMDAGDMLKFTQTTSFTAALLEAAARLDPAAAKELNGAADVGLRWLIKAHPLPDLFVLQVGDLRDHDVGFRPPESDDGSGRPGIGQRLAATGEAADVAGKAATALALAAARAKGARRATLLRHAEEWYAMGKRARRAWKPEFYAGSDWRDDLAAGAAALYRLTGRTEYARDAEIFLRRSDVSGFGWDAFAVFAAADLCGKLGAPPAADERARDLGCAKLAQAGEAAAERAGANAWGTPGPFVWGQTAESSGAGAVAALAGRRDIAARARDWLLGLNPWSASFVVGFGPNAPRHPHHWAGSFGRLPTGAVVGGPAQLKTQRAHGFEPHDPYAWAVAYEDRVANYVTSEPALDYVAASVLLVAALGA